MKNASPSPLRNKEKEEDEEEEENMMNEQHIYSRNQLFESRNCSFKNALNDNNDNNENDNNHQDVNPRKAVYHRLSVKKPRRSRKCNRG